MMTSLDKLEPRRSLSWFYHEFGLSSVINTGRDAHLIILSRLCRMFAYGACSLFIALFFSDLRIGLFLTFIFAGDVILVGRLG